MFLPATFREVAMKYRALIVCSSKGLSNISIILCHHLDYFFFIWNLTQNECVSIINSSNLKIVNLFWSYPFSFLAFQIFSPAPFSSCSLTIMCQIRIWLLAHVLIEDIQIKFNMKDVHIQGFNPLSVLSPFGFWFYINMNFALGEGIHKHTQYTCMLNSLR